MSFVNFPNIFISFEALHHLVTDDLGGRCIIIHGRLVFFEAMFQNNYVTGPWSISIKTIRMNSKVDQTVVERILEQNS